MPEGPVHLNRCVVSISWTYCAPLTAGSSVSVAFRSRFLWSKVVVATRPEDSADGLSGKLNAAELQLELIMHVAARPGGHAELVSGCEACCIVRDESREGAVPKLRPGQ